MDGPHRERKRSECSSNTVQSVRLQQEALSLDAAFGSFFGPRFPGKLGYDIQSGSSGRLARYCRSERDEKKYPNTDAKNGTASIHTAGGT